MNRTLYIGASGMAAQQLNLDTIAHDLANVNTVGYKRGRAEFAELFAVERHAPGAATAEGSSPVGVALGQGARAAAVRRDFGQGPLQETGAPLDLALEGEGFFGVQLPDGETAYTRTSTFQTDSEGRIVDAEGHPLEGDFTVPPDAETLSVAPDGTISAKVAGETDARVLGQVQVTRFVNPHGLQAVGGGLYRPTEASGEALAGNPGEDGRARVRQGFVEGSNVSVVEEMVGMITAQRAYELNARAVAAADSMLSTLNEILR
jgi:flagellar basal-body rod protein FlgG